MRIAYDGKRIVKNKTGLGNYGRYIINALSKNYPNNEYLIYSEDKGNDNLTNQIVKTSHVTYIYSKATTALSKAYWRTYSILKALSKNDIDIYHGLSNEIPISISSTSIKSIVTIHDLIFIRYPELYKWLDRTIYTWKFRYACINATRVIAISEQTKQDIITYFKIPEEKIDVVYQGCDASFSQPVRDEMKERVRVKYNLPENYILYVGSIEKRKNLLLVVKALKLSKEKVQLVAIGKKTPYVKEVMDYVTANQLDDQVTILHQIPFDELPSFYQMASIFVYPSFFEGFGIPIVEALHSNIPVIAAKGSCLEEAGGEHSIYVDPNDANALSQAIDLILNDTTVAESMRQRGKEYVQRFSDVQIAHDMMNVYKKI
jgi:glycosyltransferase involved in cell wall biosynthesis